MLLLLSKISDLTLHKATLPKSSSQNTEGSRRAEEPGQGAWYREQANRRREGTYGWIVHRIPRAEIQDPDTQRNAQPRSKGKRAAVRGYRCQAPAARTTQDWEPRHSGRGVPAHARGRGTAHAHATRASKSAYTERGTRGFRSALAGQQDMTASHSVLSERESANAGMPAHQTAVHRKASTTQQLRQTSGSAKMPFSGTDRTQGARPRAMTQQPESYNHFGRRRERAERRGPKGRGKANAHASHTHTQIEGRTRRGGHWWHMRCIDGAVRHDSTSFSPERKGEREGKHGSTPGASTEGTDDGTEREICNTRHPQPFRVWTKPGQSRRGGV